MENIRFLAEEDIQRIENNITNLFPTDNDVLEDLGLFLKKKSKRIRSLLAILYLRLNNIIINENLILLFSAGELIHNASLLHDDVIDDANTRRESITLNSKYNSKIAILSGDYLLSFAVNYLNKLDNKEILDIFINTTKSMSNAEIKQYTLRNKTVNIEQYLEIIYGKTASLFEAILKSSAVLSGLDIYKSGEFGKFFGLLFQINNDQLEDSANNDKKNAIMTITDILGIEKTNNLKDNYKEKMRALLKEFSDNKYKQGLEDLIELL